MNANVSLCRSQPEIGVGDNWDRYSTSEQIPTVQETVAVKQSQLGSLAFVHPDSAERH